MLGRIYLDSVALRHNLPGKGIKLYDALHLVAKEFDPYGQLVIGGEYLQGVSAYAELPPRHVHVVPFILHVHQVAQKPLPVSLLAFLYVGNKALVLLRRPQAVYA